MLKMIWLSVLNPPGHVRHVCRRDYMITSRYRFMCCKNRAGSPPSPTSAVFVIARGMYMHESIVFVKHNLREAPNEQCF